MITVARQAGRRLQPVLAERRAGDPSALYADIGKAQRVLGFNPRRSSPEQVIRSAYDWMRQEAEAVV